MGKKLTIALIVIAAIVGVLGVVYFTVSPFEDEQTLDEWSEDNKDFMNEMIEDVDAINGRNVSSCVDLESDVADGMDHLDENPSPSEELNEELQSLMEDLDAAADACSLAVSTESIAKYEETISYLDQALEHLENAREINDLES
jgi:hypothetical protein